MDRSGTNMHEGFSNIPHVAMGLLQTRSDLEIISPAKLALAILIREYCLITRSLDMSMEIMDDEEEEFRGMTLKQRKKIVLLMLKLIQDTDLSLSSMVNVLTDPELTIPLELLSSWKRNIVAVVWKHDSMGEINEDIVGGIMDLNSSLGKLLSMESKILHKTSIVGFYLRRLTLYFEKLNFSEVNQLFENFKNYIIRGKAALKRIEMPVDEDNSHEEDSFCSHEIANINKVDEFDVEEKLFHSRKQSEYYISKQVQLLQKCEVKADPPELIEEVTQSILKTNSDMSEAYFLSYLNCLRVNEYCGALSNLHFGSTVEKGSKSLISNEVDKGLRYSALNLAAFHAQQGHQECALAALKEAIMMAQDTNDHVCLQHALSWLFSIKKDTDLEKQSHLVKDLLSKSQRMNLGYLTGLSNQKISHIAALNGDSPTVGWQYLMRCDMASCKSFIPELISSSFAQKSAFWTLYGGTYLSVILSQLLLNLDTSKTSYSSGEYDANEPIALALCNIARKLFDSGHGKASDRVLDLTSSLFRNSSSTTGAIWKSCKLELKFRQALHKTDWFEAEMCLEKLAVVDETETLFLRLQLELWKGDTEAIGRLLRVAGAKEETEFSISHRVRFLVAKAEWYCLSSSYANAFKPLLSALMLCLNHHLKYLEATVRLHLAHVKLQLDLPLDSLGEIKAILPMILSQDDSFESARAHLLYAKCLVAASAISKEKNSSAPSMEERRFNFLLSIKHLKKALEGFRVMQSHHRAKDVLYMMARLYHAMDKVAERNQASAEFKKLEELEPTNMASKLAKML